MGFNFGGTQANVTLTSSSLKQTATLIAGSRDTSGTTDLGTVGAGKVWRILSVAISAYGLGAASANCQIQLNGVAALFVRPSSSATVPANLTNSLNWEYEACPVLTAGQKVQILCENSNGVYGQCCYVEESA